MKVLCLNPPAEKGFIRTGRWARKSRANQSWYPIHLAYLTGFLQKHGYNAGLYDAAVLDRDSDMTYLYIKEVLKPDVIFYYWCYDNMRADLAYANYLAKYSRVILVGPWSHCAPDALIHTPNISIMTYGEFEYTALDILENTNISDIRGIIWRDEHNYINTNAPRKLCTSEELDTQFPFVSSVYQQFLMLRDYRQTSLKYPFIDMFGARGCTNSCSYCLWVKAFQNGPRYRSRSISNILEELYFIHDNLDVKQIFFQDDTLPQKHAVDLSQSILDHNLHITWGGYSRAELSYETLKLMRDSGCRTLHIGYESPIQSNLDAINKHITVEQMEEFAHNIKKLGMWTSATFMLFPWMTKDEIKRTIDWAKRIKPKRINFIQAQAYPNTPYADTLKNMSEKQTLMTYEQMKEWEQWGFKRFYIYNPRFWLDALTSPTEWRNVLRDSSGLINFLLR